MSAPSIFDTPAYWREHARNERAFANDPQQTVESQRVHLANAVEYETRAAKLEAA